MPFCLSFCLLSFSLGSYFFFLTFFEMVYVVLGWELPLSYLSHIFLPRLYNLFIKFCKSFLQSEAIFLGQDKPKHIIQKPISAHNKQQMAPIPMVGISSAFVILSASGSLTASKNDRKMRLLLGQLAHQPQWHPIPRDISLVPYSHQTYQQFCGVKPICAITGILCATR